MISPIENLYGLVLAGGKSSRMGQDKGLLNYKGLPHREYLFGMLSRMCEKTFMSVRKEQKAELVNFPAIVDQDNYKGPFNGILSAHNAYPEVAWLVVACDLPLIDSEHLQDLITKRVRGADATAFATHSSGLPEPLVAIWEPKGLKTAMEYLETAQSSCPRKFLLNHQVKLIFPMEDKVLSNANHPEEYQAHLKNSRNDGLAAI